MIFNDINNQLYIVWHRLYFEYPHFYVFALVINQTMIFSLNQSRTHTPTCSAVIVNNTQILFSLFRPTSIERAYSTVYTLFTALHLVKNWLHSDPNKWRPPNLVNTATIQLDFISPSLFISIIYLATSLSIYLPIFRLRYYLSPSPV